MPIFYKMIVYVYICLHIKVLRRQILSLDRKCVSKNALLCIILYIFISIQAGILCPYVWFRA